MATKKQTAVELLLNKVKLMIAHGSDFGDDLPALLTHIEHAKELEIEQIKSAWDNGAIDASYGTKYKSYEDYYSQTYGGGDE